MITTQLLLDGTTPIVENDQSLRESNYAPRRVMRSKVLQLGAVTYLNSKPLVRELRQEHEQFHYSLNFDLKLDYPSRLAQGLRGGLYDVALVPSIEYMLGRETGLDYEIVSNACVAARGPVLSVKVFFNTHPGEVKTLLLDEGSRTSAMLTKILLAEKYGVYPECRQLSLELSPWDQQADAMLVIGDRAMHQPLKKYAYVWDLGEEWLSWTGYPFVFAMWVTRSHLAENVELSAILEHARDQGVAQIKQIAHEEAGALGISENLAELYLSKHLHFTLKSAEMRGMELYFKLAKEYLSR